MAPALVWRWQACGLTASGSWRPVVAPEHSNLAITDESHPLPGRVGHGDYTRYDGRLFDQTLLWMQLC